MAHTIYRGLNERPCRNEVEVQVDLIPSAPLPRGKGGTVDSSPKCNNTSSRADMSCLVESHGKDGKQRTLPTFPRHGYGDLYDSIPDIRCTWTLNVPTPPRGLVPFL